MSFAPWVIIPVDNVMVAVDYDYGDVRIIFKDTKTIDNVIEQLHNIRGIVKETEEAK